MSTACWISKCTSYLESWCSERREEESLEERGHHLVTADSSTLSPTPNPQHILTSRTKPAILSLTLALLLATPLLTALLILFGAPLTSNQQHTLLAAAHISHLAILPLIYTHGLEKEKWMAIMGLMVPVDDVFGAALGTFVGAWVGAVPIPLDW
jgi:hypothetical protein